MPKKDKISKDHDQYKGDSKSHHNWGIFKNEFFHGKHTEQQAYLAMHFMHVLAKCVHLAQQVVEMRLDNPKAQIYVEDLEIHKEKKFQLSLVKLQEIQQKVTKTKDDLNFLKTFSAASKPWGQPA